MTLHIGLFDKVNDGVHDAHGEKDTKDLSYSFTPFALIPDEELHN